jgi:hypothetical protein
VGHSFLEKVKSPVSPTSARTGGEWGIILIGALVTERELNASTSSSLAPYVSCENFRWILSSPNPPDSMVIANKKFVTLKVSFGMIAVCSGLAVIYTASTAKPIQ